MKKAIALTTILMLLLSLSSVAMAATVTRGPHNYGMTAVKNYTYSVNELDHEYYEGYDWTSVTDNNSVVGFDWIVSGPAQQLSQGYIGSSGTSVTSQMTVRSGRSVTTSVYSSYKRTAIIKLRFTNPYSDGVVGMTSIGTFSGILST